MSGLNPDDLEIIKEILGPEDDDDDPIFGKSSHPANPQKNTPIVIPPKPSINNTNDSICISNTPTLHGIPNGPFQKCTSVCIGGSDLPVGMTTEEDGPRVCSSLSCVKCDHNVLRFPDRRWKKTTDYLFLRNNFPEKVQQNLVPAPGWCAYCCQCQFCEERESKKLPQYSSSWVCRGHK